MYLLTDAERNTGTYSNRFAGHILRQHQFHSLTAIRGWHNKLRIMADATFPPATRELPQWGLRAEFWIKGYGDDAYTDIMASGSYLRLATDQVRFYPAGVPQNAAHDASHDGSGYYMLVGRGQEPVPPVPLTEIPLGHGQLRPGRGHRRRASPAVRGRRRGGDVTGNGLGCGREPECDGPGHGGGRPSDVARRGRARPDRGRVRRRRDGRRRRAGTAGRGCRPAGRGGSRPAAAGHVRRRRDARPASGQPRGPRARPVRQRRAAGRARRGEGGRGRLPAEVGDAPGVARRGAPHRRRRGGVHPGARRARARRVPPAVGRTRPGQAGACRGCQNARPRSSAWSPPACPTSRSPPGSSCPTAPCRTTCRTRWASCNCTTGSSWSGTRSSTVLRGSSRRASRLLRGQAPPQRQANRRLGRDGADLGGRPEQARLRHRV